MRAEERHEFASDNTAGVCPEAKRAFENANAGWAAAYGEDQWTALVSDRIRKLFECDCTVYLVPNGTAANALALAQVCRPYHAILCHERAHINVDECGACEFFTGGSRLIAVTGENGKIDLKEAGRALARHHEIHSYKPHVVSVTQATELGTLYTCDELRMISAFARQRDLLLHMDGARFANAVAALGCSPKELTWQLGVDLLCFGGTKNGLAAGELIIFFDASKAEEFEYRRKQGGQLISKMRFLAVPWLDLLDNGVWLRNASHANFSARALGTALAARGAEVVYPVEANSVFLRLNDLTVQRLSARGWFFYKFVEPDVYRLMCSWATTENAIAAFVTDFEATKSCAADVR